MVPLLEMASCTLGPEKSTQDLVLVFIGLIYRQLLKVSRNNPRLEEFMRTSVSRVCN